jgi:hypothetical protein
MPSWAIYGNERRRGMHAEPGAANLLTQPSAFDHADWTKTNCSISTNVEGTADRITEASDTAQYHYVLQSITKAGSAISYVLSVRAKVAPSDTWTRIALGVDDGVDSGYQCAFDVSTNELGALNTLGANFSNGARSITSLGSGWYTCELSFTTSTTTTLRCYIFNDAGASTAAVAIQYNGNGVQGMLIDQASLVAA